MIISLLFHLLQVYYRNCKAISRINFCNCSSKSLIIFKSWVVSTIVFTLRTDCQAIVSFYHKKFGDYSRVIISSDDLMVLSASLGDFPEGLDDIDENNLDNMMEK